jgi:outer membrane protein OmpA-like peptidoglycan-associated protein
MKKYPLTTLVVTISVMLGACSSTPLATSLLEQTRIDYQVAQSNPQVASYATLEMKEASDALAMANTAADKRESTEAIDKLAYLAKQKIALTQEVAKQKSAEADIAKAGKVRDQVRLEQRTIEADQAKMKAASARIVAQAALDETAAAQQKEQLAKQETERAQMQTLQAQERAANLEKQLAAMAAKKTERGFVITLGDVLFGTDLARLNADGMRTAQKLADFLRDNPQRTVLVEGFTDSTGSAAHNQDLSERRAGAVTAALKDLGIARDRMTAKGYGESYPVAANDLAKDRQLNRRVEIVLSDESGKTTSR